MPLLLIIVDGICTSLTGKHPFSGGVDAPVFDSIASEPGGISDAFKILGAVRRKVSTEPISIPFRHGIIHGLNPVYDNALVAAKSVNLLRAMIDYFDRRRDEVSRIEKATEEQNPPGLLDLVASIRKTEALKRATDVWHKRPDKRGNLASSFSPFVLDSGSPEAVAATYLGYLAARNFGKLAALTIDYPQRPTNMRAGRMAGELRGFIISKWEITGVEDMAAAVSNVAISIEGKTNGKAWAIESKMRLVYSEDDNHPLPRGFEGGEWLVMPNFITDVSLAHMRSS